LKPKSYRVQKTATELTTRNFGDLDIRGTLFRLVVSGSRQFRLRFFSFPDYSALGSGSFPVGPFSRQGRWPFADIAGPISRADAVAPRDIIRHGRQANANGQVSQKGAVALWINDSASPRYDRHSGIERRWANHERELPRGSIGSESFGIGEKNLR
jgi:hypothetical protein